MTKAGILYASTSGRTRKLISTFEAELAPVGVDSYDLRDGALPNFADYDFWIFGSPTYGIGDWHNRWEKWSDKIAESNVNWSQMAIAVFALGDGRHHPESFGAAILDLSNFVDRLKARLIGRVAIDETYEAELCEPLLTDERFPGLVLDQVRQRQLGAPRIRAWAAQLHQELTTREVKLRRCCGTHAQTLFVVLCG